MRRLTILVDLLAVVLVACGEQDQGNDMEQPFIGGNAGINLYLQNGMPPPTVFDAGNNPFGIGVVVENIGEADIGGDENPFMELRVEGLLPQNFGISDADLLQSPDVVISGAQKNFDGTIIPGDVHNAVFQPLNYQLALQGNQLHTFRVSACYDYTNRATSLLCMKDDVLENVQDSTICTLTGPKPVANSGGPLHVTEIVQNPMDSNLIQVNMRIAHVGSGEFYGRGPDEQCDTSPRNMNKYKVDVLVETDDQGATVSCNRLGGSNQGELSMFGGSEQVLTCTVEGSETSSRVYQTGLNVELSYRYGEFIEDQFIIQAVPNE